MTPKFQRFDGPSKNVFVTGHELGSGQSAFGEVINTSNMPIIQLDFTHIVPPRTEITEVNGGTAVRNPVEGTMVVSTGTNVSGLAAFVSSRTLVYRAGQGNMVRFSAKFTTAVPQSRQSAGAQSPTDGFTFSYEGTVFGINYRRGGDVELRELQITTLATGAETATVTTNGNAYSVSLTGVGTLVGDANEIADSLNAQDPLGIYQQVGDTVLYQAAFPDPQTVFAFSSASAVAAWTTTTTGVDITETFIPQSTWNMNKKSDLDPTKFNVYQIQYQFLGSGAIEFFIEDSDTGQFVLVHRIKFANTSTVPSLKNPNLPLAIFVISEGSTTNLSVETVSMAAFRQGEFLNSGQAAGLVGSVTATATEQSVFTIKVRDEVGGRLLLGELTFNSVVANTDSNKGAIFNLLLGATVNGVQDFAYHDKDASMVLVDNTQATVTGGVLIGVVDVGGEGSANFLFDNPKGFLLPNETLTITARVISGAAATCGAFVSWSEGI